MTVAATALGRLKEAAIWLLTSRIVWIWVGVWILTRGLMVVEVGFWNHELGVNYQDAEFYSAWSETLAHQHAIPAEDSWQYPPGAAFFLLVPRIGVSLFSAAYQPSFMVLMLLVDLAGLVLMMLLARRTERNLGVWVWLLAIPILQANPITRFDLAPTVLIMAALVLIQRRPAWFGAIVGIGASIKVWPVVALLGEWNRRRLAIAVAAAAAAVAVTFLFSAAFFGDQSGFFDNQGTRGLQKESVGAIPWYARWTITGEEPPLALRNGSAEIGSALADNVAVVLKWLGLLALLAAALWWVLRERAIRRGRTDLTDVSLSRDFVFTIVLVQIVVSRVLSPQYMLWLIGVAAVILSAGPTRLARPIWITLGAVVVTAAVPISSANMMIRNLALLVAGIDAILIMVAALREPSEEHADSRSVPSDASAPDIRPSAGTVR